MTDRYTCTKEAPWSPEKGEFAVRPDAVLERENYGGIVDNWERYKCPNCGLQFTEELDDG